MTRSRPSQPSHLRAGIVFRIRGVGALSRCLLAACSLSVACGGGASPEATGERRLGDARVGGEVVSTVDGQPITRSDVARAARVAGVGQDVALRRLQDEAVLWAAAERAGYGDDRAVRRAGRQAAVQALLRRRVEAAVDGTAVPRSELDALYQQSRERFSRPPRRASVHVLARLSEDASRAAAAAAEAWVTDRVAELGAAPDPELAALAMAGRFTDLPFEVSVEEVPPLASDAPADAAYLNALFSLPDEGVVPRPVRTAFGWHALVLTSMEPAVDIGEDEAIEILRAERVAARRAVALTALVEQVAAEVPTTVDPSAARRALADDAFGSAR